MTKQIHEMSAEELGRLFPIILVRHDKKWEKLYNTEKILIKKTLGHNIVRIEHIGSSAVPDLMSKPTIDILLELEENVKNETIINSFKGLGYHYIPKTENPPPHMMFVKGYTINGFKGQIYHVHARYCGDWDEIYFRDYLISNPIIAKEYEDLKLQLAKKYKYNREEYTSQKTEFIKRITEKSKIEFKK